MYSIQPSLAGFYPHGSGVLVHMQAESALPAVVVIVEEVEHGVMVQCLYCWYLHQVDYMAVGIGCGLVALLVCFGFSRVLVAKIPPSLCLSVEAMEAVEVDSSSVLYSKCLYNLI